MNRWKEEVKLLLEEMRRILCYMGWHAQHWRLLVAKRQVADEALREGLAAYANDQACIRESMGKQFEDEWCPLLEGHSIGLFDNE